jgi:hypothetical protein
MFKALVCSTQKGGQCVKSIGFVREGEELSGKDKEDPET